MRHPHRSKARVVRLVTEDELREAAKGSPTARMVVEELLAAIQARRDREREQHKEAAE